MTIISADSDLGGQEYPFLQRAPGWRIHTRPVTADASADVDETAVPTLRWVKDDKVCDLVVPDMDTESFLALTGLSLSLQRGPYVLSKRISRIMRPYRYFAFFAPDELVIEHDPQLDAVTWDGAGLISRRVVERIAARLDKEDPHYELYRRELETTRRFEVTVMHAGGQEKGHVLIVEDGDHDSLAVDFLFPAGSAKSEITLRDRVFVGLHPVHAADQMRLDVQSLINLHPFFRPEHLLAWLSQESALFLQAIRDGAFDVLLSRLGRFHAEEDFSQFRSWWLAEYLLSGGELMWFPGTVKAMGRQHLNRLGRAERKFRFPIPGGRYYILPAEVGGRDVAPGHVMLEPETATAWVNAADWNETIVEVLGGCDGDDGVWVFPFTDYDDTRKVLVWRSPNQLGEYVLLQPSPQSHVIQWRTPLKSISFPPMDSRQLPPRIDTVCHDYGELARFDYPDTDAYAIACMTPAIEQARLNRGALGAYCNMLLLIKAVYGRLPEKLPARLEDVIDGSVKSFRDLSPVLAWVNMAASHIVAGGKAIPRALRRRIEPSLTPKEVRRLRFTDDHWLDTLLAAVQHHIEVYQANLTALTAEATPPLALFQAGVAWCEPGNGLRHVYAAAVRDGRDREETAVCCHRYLRAWPKHQSYVILGAAAQALGDSDLSDAVLWQKEIAPLTIAALRTIGLLGEPMWTGAGAVLYYDDPPPTAVPITFHGVWINWLRTQQPDTPTQMSAVPAATRRWAKQQIRRMAARAFDNLILHMRVTDDDRVVAYTEHGNLFGYVKAGQELRAVKADAWRIVQARAKDGNVAAVLTPA